MFAEADFSLVVSLSPWQQWLVRHFAQEADIPLLVGDEVDHDGDGLGNLHEYVLGNDPGKPDAVPVTLEMVEIADEKRLRVSFRKTPAPASSSLESAGA